ncbi:MAG: hypothetical protein JO285_01200 [Kutzneria sp.]|nr:hypothetical protein [Kutzneria sp.]
MSDDSLVHSWDGERPQVKVLTEELFVQLGAGQQGYAEALLAEYGRADEVVDQRRLREGTLCVIGFPEAPGRPAWTTHLIFGGCTEPQAREYLVSIGLGGVPISTVYPPAGVIPDGQAPADSPDEL